MPHNIDLILTLTGGLTAALALGFITQKLKLSPIVGYLLAGIIVGPYTPGFVADSGIASQSAEIGVILLMFGVGLHFDLKDLMAVRTVAIPGAIAQIGAATALGLVATKLFGWSWAAGLIFGVAISVASTVALTRVLADILGYVSRTGSRELFTVAVLVLAMSIAVGAAKFFGASMALGAFLAGMIVGQSSFSERAASEALPMRDAFAVLFFVSVGMLFDPSAIREGWPLALVILDIVLIGKPIAAFILGMILKRPLRVALDISVALA